MAVLFTILEQMTIAFGGHTFEELRDLSSASIISRMAKYTAEQAVSIVLCDPLCSMMGRESEEDVIWVTQSLPPNIRLVLITSCVNLRSIKSALVLELPAFHFEESQDIFLNRLQAQHRCVTAKQQEAVMAVLHRSSQPALAVLLSSVAAEWRSHEQHAQSDIPDNVKDSLLRLLEQAEQVVGRECVAIVLSYLSTVKFGLSDSELEDVLALDTRLMSVLYPAHLPQVRRCPLSIWLYLKYKLSMVMDVAYVYGHRVYRWQRQAYGELVLGHYKSQADHFHAQLADYFSGSWASTPKPMPDPTKKREMVAVPCAVLQQPNSNDKYTNCRKFMSLLYHMLQGLPSVGTETDVMTQRIKAAKQHLLNLRWLVIKLDATSLVQLLDDLQMAKSTAASMSMELSWLQMLVARYASSLNVSGHHLRTHLYMEISEQSLEQNSKMDDVRQVSFSDAMSKLYTTITKSSVPFLVFNQRPLGPKICSGSDLSSNVDTAAANQPPCLNGFFSYGTDGSRVISISTLAGEIIVWDTESNRAVQTMKNIEKPSDLVFLDAQKIVVLCNRQLKAFHLETGELFSNIRGMLNIKMPYFHVRDSNTVIVLARNRMSVNVLDVNSGQIHATFKAGEDRFLNSLLVSGNGKMLVCGDETQKPSPLLVWELGQTKLLYDLRMQQHEFITSIADITHNGHFVACACRGVYDTANNFVVVYDLQSGQLYRQFRLGASVTAVSVASRRQCVVMTLSDGSLAVFDITTGMCISHPDGVKATYNKVQLSSDETLAVSYSVNAGAMPIACTVAFWDIDTGRFLASYTFDSMVMCCQYVAHNDTILVGLASCRYYVVLSLFHHQSSSVETTTSTTIRTRKSSEQQPLWRLAQTHVNAE
ncbi:NACHT and WD repeat domain-containing protein 2-like [Babylonia areolata]|uniref:NACHT and WD repeat domain-containing protein 2-like n=1 Tax=Babylonia areolata TaxID=304850 RepID=UPI003FD5E07A